MSRERYEPIDLNVYRGNEGEGHFRNMLRVDNYLRDLSDRRATETHGGGGGGGGAPTDADYLVLSANATLTDERILAVTSPIQKADTGAGGTLTISINQAGIDHGSLNATSLLDDDHPQYLRSDASDNYTSGTLTLDAGTTLEILGDLDISGATLVGTTPFVRHDGTVELSGDWGVGTSRSITEVKNLRLVSGDTDPLAGLQLDHTETPFGTDDKLIQAKTNQIALHNTVAGSLYSLFWGAGVLDLAATHAIRFGTTQATMGRTGFTFNPTSVDVTLTTTANSTGETLWELTDRLRLHDDTVTADPMLRVDWDGTGDRVLFRCEANAGPQGTPFAVSNYGIQGAAKSGSNSAQTFIGSGLNDGTYSGTFSGAAVIRFRVQIIATGTPDAFRWSTDGGLTNNGSNISITGGAQLLQDGISITFGATTGHTLSDAWDITYYPDTDEVWVDGNSRVPKITVDNNTAGGNALIFDTATAIGPGIFPYVFLSAGAWRGEIGSSASFSSPIASIDPTNPKFIMAALADTATMEYDYPNDVVTFDKDLRILGSASTDELTLTSATPLFLTDTSGTTTIKNSNIWLNIETQAAFFGTQWTATGTSTSVNFLGNSLSTLFWFAGGQGSLSTTQGNLVLSAADSGGVADLSFWAEGHIYINEGTPGPGTADIHLLDDTGAAMLRTVAGTSIINLNSPTDCLEQTAPSAPAANTLRLFNSNVTGELSVIDSGSTVTSLMGGGVEPVPFATEVDDAGAGVTYIGEAAAGTATSAALWRIKKMTETGPDISIIWADGDTDQDNIWDNRASLSYS